jgi:hypothetical protein
MQFNALFTRSFPISTLVLTCLIASGSAQADSPFPEVTPSAGSYNCKAVTITGSTMTYVGTVRAYSAEEAAARLVAAHSYLVSATCSKQ